MEGGGGALDTGGGIQGVAPCRPLPRSLAVLCAIDRTKIPAKPATLADEEDEQDGEADGRLAPPHLQPTQLTSPGMGRLALGKEEEVGKRRGRVGGVWGVPMAKRHG